MSLRRNVLATYVSQLYVTLVGIALVPMYLRYMGAEAFGLVGFFTMLQAWFNLLDMGLTSALGREAARYCGGVTDGLTFRRLVRALEGIFLLVAAIGGLALFLTSRAIAHEWLRAADLSLSEIHFAVQMMALAIATRWMAGLYRSIISGSERLIWLASFNSVIATLKFAGVLPAMIALGATPRVFFTYQAGIAAIELAGLSIYAYRLLPEIAHLGMIRWSWAPLRPMLKFSLSLAFVSAVWVFVTQTDKLVLSRLLPLAEYGYFSLAVLVASSVMVISTPVSSALMPHMARLEAQGDHPGLIWIYRQSTQLVTVLCGAASITAALFAERLLWAWTGDHGLAHRAAPLLALYALGNGLVTVSAFPFYLQYAKGDLRLHFVGNAIFAVLFVPLMILGAWRYGALGAGYAWLGLNALSFVGWLPLVHRKFAPGLNLKWYLNDVLAIVLPISLSCILLSRHLPSLDSRWAQLILVLAAGSIAAAFGAAGSSGARAIVVRRLAGGARRDH